MKNCNCYKIATIFTNKFEIDARNDKINTQVWEV